MAQGRVERENVGAVVWIHSILQSSPWEGIADGANVGSEMERRVRGVLEAGLLNLRPGDILGLRILCGGGWAEHRRMLICFSILRLVPPTPNSCDNQNCKLSPYIIYLPWGIKKKSPQVRNPMWWRSFGQSHLTMGDLFIRRKSRAFCLNSFIFSHFSHY